MIFNDIGCRSKVGVAARRPAACRPMADPSRPNHAPAMPVPRLAKAANSMLRHGLTFGLNPVAQTTMTAPLKAVDGNADLPALMNELGAQARAAARVLSLAPPEQKNRALEAMERAIRAHAAAI